MTLSSTLLFLALATTSLSQNNPLKDPNICGRPTCNGNQKFGYEPGTQQTYKYTVQVSSLFNGTSKNESSFHVEGIAKLNFLTPCDGLLTLSDVTLNERSGTSDTPANGQIESIRHANSEMFSDMVAENTVRFAFNDGVIYEVCPQDEEKNWVLNFKKGLLSMLHNTMRRFDLDHSTVEEDVRGRCNTMYRVKGPKDTSLIIQKTKDLTTCESRSKLHSMVQSTPYHFQTEHRQGASLLKSESFCELSIDHHIYNAITCDEVHIFQPFSNRDAGAMTILKQKLILLDEVSEHLDEQPSINRRTSLLFDHVPTPKPTSGELKSSRNLIKKLCLLTSDVVQTEFSDVFTKFIHTARVLSRTALSALYSHAGSICPSGKKHLLDALPYIRNNAAVILMKDIILNGGVSESTINEWMLMISLIARPDDAMMEAVAELLEKKIDSSAITLSVSALTHTYCTQNIFCRSSAAIDAIIQLLEDKVTNAYRSGNFNRATQENIMIGLKGLSNIGEASVDFKSELKTMIENTTLDIALRVTAIEAHRRLPCEQSRHYFEKLFRNPDHDPEVRIAAYLQVMRCPNYVVIRTIRHTLEIEEVNQVGAFVWSHLNNLLKSSIPSRVEVQGLLSDKDLLKKFNSDARKFSHNYEGSIFFEEYDAGANYESNVIFSPSSFIPKSVMLNLTVDLFGESINLLEVYCRMEGFEHYLESIFGPKGPFSSAQLKKKLRPTRSVAETENDILQSQINKLPNIIEENFKTPKVAAGMKVFGNELKYSVYDGEDELKKILNNINPVDNLKRILSGKEIEYNKATMFLDSSYIVPSGAGLPLTLNAIGSASVKFKLFGSLRALNFMKMKELDLVGNVSPSVAVNVIGTMSVDGYFASTAIKLKTNLYTSSAVEGKLKIRGTKLVSAEFGLPQKTMEIFGAKSELIVMKGSVEEEQSGLTETLVNTSICSWPAVEKTVGLKLCSDYKFVNVTGLDQAASFILSGPANLRVHVQKTDPTAKKYLLEYKWITLQNSSAVSVTFDTPGSNVRRILGANFTIDTQSQNLTLLLQSSAGTVLAKGKYKNSENEKYLSVSLDINNNKHFDGVVSLNKTESLNGFTYFPKFYLAVNEERIVELQGTLKVVQKKKVSQYDVDIKFKTKRVSSKLFGYLSKTEASIATNLKLDYKFPNVKEQRVVVQFSLANRSTPTIAAILGDFSVTSTAYPNWNFDSALKFQRGNGHVECKLEVNSNPLPSSHPEVEFHKLTMQMLFSYRTLKDGTRLNMVASVARPSTELDLRGEFSYDVSGPHTNAMLVVRYSKDKDVVVTVYWSHPYAIFEHIEGRLNITIPSFTPMILEVKLHEKAKADYIVEISATSFSGHRLNARGIYQDKSTDRASNHHLKLLLRSPSFQEITTDCQYYRDNTEFKIDLKADHIDDQYALFWKHTTNSSHETSTQGKLKYKTQLYSITSCVQLKEERRALVELHIDQYRDIRLEAWGYNKETNKAAGLEVKWDANRDPNQKLAVTVDFYHPATYNYSGNFIVSYPGRTINGIFYFNLLSGHVSTMSRLSWSSEETIAVLFKAEYKNDYETLFIVHSELITPFDEWGKTSLNGKYQHHENMYHANGSLHWHNDQHVAIDLFEDYEIKGQYFKGELRAELISTVDDIPTISASVKHSHNTSKIDTNLKFMYHPEQIIAVDSIWYISEDQITKNLTGAVTLVSPFKGYNKGVFVSKICVINRRYLRAIADLDLDHKKYTANVDGYFHKVTKNMLAFNITTPIEKMKELKGRFGISEERKHIVAEVLHPTGSIGFEVLLYVESFSRFDVKVSLGTPIEFLQKILIVGKLETERADFRLAWNSLLVGFVGIWHYTNITDLEYSYKIYTPIEGFEENGVVAKLIFKEGLDFELSINFAEDRLGITVAGKDKPKVFKELGVKTQAIYVGNLAGGVGAETKSANDEGEDDEGEYEDALSWTGLIEIDALIYPTMKGTLDIDQKGTVYVVLGTLTLPDGAAELKDEFDFIDFFTMKNKFYLSTPYKRYEQVTSNCELLIMPGHKYVLGIDFNYKNIIKWIETGAFVSYKSDSEEDEVTRHDVILHVHTPFESMPRLDLRTSLEMEENIYRTNFSMSTTTSNISVGANAELDEGLLDTNVALHVNTPIIFVPPMQINFKKDFSELENIIEFGFDVHQHKSNKFNLDAKCRYQSIKNLDVHILLLTPFRGMEKSELGSKLLVNDGKAEASLVIVLHPIDLKANAFLKDAALKADLTFDFNQKRSDIGLFCTISSPTANRREIQGTLNLKGKVFIVRGTAELTKDIPTNLNLQFEPEEGGEAVKFDYQLQPQPTGYALRAIIKHTDKFARFEVHTNTRNEFNWDLHMKIETSHHEYKTFTIDAKTITNGTSRNLLIEAKTPIAKLDNPRLGGSLTIHGEENRANLYYEITNSKGSIDAVWTWLIMENMSVRLIGNYRSSNYSSEANAVAFYTNPNKAFQLLKFGTDIRLNNIWSMGGNFTLGRPAKQKIQVNANLKLPPPSHEIHTLMGDFQAGKNFETVAYSGKYHTKYSSLNYGSTGNLISDRKTRIKGNVDVEWGAKRVKNYLDLQRKQNNVNFLYKLHTPKYLNEETFITKMNYRGSEVYHNVTCEAFYPASRSVVFAEVDFREFANMNGTVNVTTPVKGLNYTGAHFLTETTTFNYKRYVQLFWPNNSALFDSLCSIRDELLSKARDTKGQIVVEIPLTTRHIAHIDYDYNEKPQLSTGQATVEYNGEKVLDGKYNCMSESRAGFDKDTIHVELQNKLVPVGADYFREFEYAAPGDGSNTPTMPTVSMKRLDLYNLYNRTKFNVTGKLDVRTTFTGRQIMLSTTHSNRTVKFSADYDVLDKQYSQHSRLELEPTAWIEFDLNVLNKTMDETFEAQQIQINVSYPRRNFTASGSYNVSDLSLSSDVSLVWDKERKTVQAGLDWLRDELNPNHHQVELQIKHPSFQKDVSLRGEYESAGRKIALARLTVDYSADPQQTLKLGGDIDNNCDRYTRNYTYKVWAVHPMTNLDLNMRGGVFWRPRWYNVEHLADYKRTYLPLQSAESSARIDFIQNEIKLKKKNLHELSYLWGRYAGKFPLYTANVSAIYGKDINASGEFYLNFREKLLQLELNKTADGSQSIHMYGVIPDARSAIFNIWRDYDDIRVSDVAYLLRLNHSRLLVSSLHWRPDLKQSIQNDIQAASVRLHQDIMKSTDYWKQYIWSETTDAIADVWQDARPLVRNFLDDVKDLKVIENDLDELKVFMNNSYYANEFYIRDFVDIVVYMFDELSIKSHIENLPAIVSEIWEVMGDSGKKIQKSILWVIEKIKFYYKNFVEFINGLVQGESVEHLSDAFKQLVEKYDNFIKDMHVAFIRYMEQLWKQTYALMVDNWHKTLALIEPTFLKIIHYLETIVWNTSKEFLDFLYIRKNEIIEHPYFSKFSNFSQDLDRFYKDMTGNSTLTNVVKYTKIVWNFLKEKYFKLVPFSKELEDVISEIISELNELKNLPSVRFLTQLYNEMYGRLKWFYEYFDVENRLHRFITLIHLKLTDMKQTALQAENRYREAKTKFIYEPADGIMDLEQKLPIPWHAFNESPIFREIPEYKSIIELQNYFVTTRTSFWNFYYDYKPYTDPADWFPPFNEQAMILGSGYYVTFDRNYYHFQGGCSYLLASDFLDGNFSVIVEYDGKNKSTHELIILVNGTVVHINVFNDSVRIGNAAVTRLPVNIADGTILYRDADIVTLNSASGFILECNMKFDVCMFDVSGWYFGKTAGLWGTMNNEPSDDLLTSDRQKVKVPQLKRFTDSWSLDQQCVGSETDNRYATSMIRAPSAEVQALCKDFFSSNVSPFDTCFSRISNEPFLSMCLNSTSQYEACSSAVAYIDLCAYVNTPLRIPDACIKCNLLNGSVLAEGEYVRLEGDDVPQSADVVFIVEAKECNDKMRTKRNMDALLETLDRELINLNITNNRYSVVAFGGDGVFNHPRSIVINNEIFTDEHSIPTYFDYIPTGKGNADIFNSITFASELQFRPGVSKDFILLPCSDCHEDNMKLDYAILHQLLRENDITLHILMNEEFVFQKTRVNKIFFGIDSTLAYTKKDIHGLKGDAGLRRQVRLPKSTLGFCTPLALETNGSVFSAKKLEVGKQSNVKKFAAVFAKRVALTAVPTECMMCECTAPNTGVPYTECLPCKYPSRAIIDYGFDEDEALSVMQPGDEDIMYDYE